MNGLRKNITETSTMCWTWKDPYRCKGLFVCLRGRGAVERRVGGALVENQKKNKSNVDKGSRGMYHNIVNRVFCKYKQVMKGVADIQSNNVPIGEKIKALRMARGFSQEQLALSINIVRSSLSAMETGAANCPLNMQWAIKNALDAKGIPLTEPERQGFKDRLYVWYNLFRESKFESAKKLQEELSVITLLPLDIELNALYRLFCAGSSLRQNEVDIAREAISAVEAHVDGFSSELLYHYYFSKGTLACRDDDYKAGLDFYLQARSLSEHNPGKNSGLPYSIAYCLSRLGYAVSTIFFLENFGETAMREKLDTSSFPIKNLLAVNYIRIKRFHKAKELLMECFTLATTETQKNTAVVNYGYLYYSTGDWSTAIMYLDEALNYWPQSSWQYLEALYLKVWCLINLGNMEMYNDLIVEGQKLSEDNETYTILFHSLEKVAEMSVGGDISYIEDVTIPYLLSEPRSIRAIHYCTLLKAHYEKKGSIKKMLYLEKIINSISKDILEGGVFE